MTGLPIGFVALWKNKRSEYHAGPDEEKRTSRAIATAFELGRSRGIEMFGRYGCRWSSEYQYFTFWRCPDLESLEATMHDLEQAGDFKFADSYHIIGNLESALPTPITTISATLPYAEWSSVVLWRGSRTARAERMPTPDEAVAEACAPGVVQSIGAYNSRWSTSWEGWTIWLSSTFEEIEGTVARLEDTGVFAALECRFFVGNLEPQFRFGTHLQAETASAEDL